MDRPTAESYDLYASLSVYRQLKQKERDGFSPTYAIYKQNFHLLAIVELALTLQAVGLRLQCIWHHMHDWFTVCTI